MYFENEFLPTKSIYFQMISVGVEMMHLVVVMGMVVLACWYDGLSDKNCDMEKVSLEGKVVVVTGANRGIGYQIALEVAKR